MASARVVLPDPELPRRATLLTWSAWNVFMFFRNYILYIFIIYSLFGGDKNNNFLKQFKKVQRIPNFLFPLHQFFETQEYRFSLQGKFTKYFHRGGSGSNLLITYISS
jgi:hypothetical protein